MPQMAPIWWTFIMLISISMLVLMITSTYFILFKKNKYNKNKFTKSLNWTW